MSADEHLNPQLFDPGPAQQRGEKFFHFGEEPTFDTARPSEAHAGTRKSAEVHAQNRFHQGSLHHLELRPDADRFNTPSDPASDHWANAVASVDEGIASMYGNFPEDREANHGKAIFYDNDVEDAGSVSVVAPASAYEYLGSEPHTPVKTVEHDYHTKTEYGRGREGIGIQRPGVNLQPKLFGLAGTPSPYVTGMPDHGVPAGRKSPTKDSPPSLEETFSKL